MFPPPLLLLLLPFIAASPVLLGTPGVIGAYGFEGTVPIDSTHLSGSSVAYLGNGQYALPNSQCVYGSCMWFNGTYINFTQRTVGFSTRAYTVAAWIAPYIPINTYGTEIFFSVFDNVSNSLEFGVTGYGMAQPNPFANLPNVFRNAVQQSYLNGTSYVFPFAPSPSNWTHIAYVFDGAYVRLYINATLQSAFISVASLTIESTSNTFRIGDIAGYGYNRLSYQGLIDELGIFNIALNQSQIFALYNVANLPSTNAPSSAPSSSPTSEPSVTDYLMSQGMVTALIWVAIIGVVVFAVCAACKCGSRRIRTPQSELMPLSTAAASL